MANPYPPHDPRLSYVGKLPYSLTFCTLDRARTFTSYEPVELVQSQILRAARECQFEMTAYCFMPDHLHLLVTGLVEAADCRAFIKAAKQYSGYYFKQKYGRRLWQRYGFERVIRDDVERAFVIGYIVCNPVRSGLVPHPNEYRFIGSERYTVFEMLEICEYRGPRVLPPEGGSHESGIDSVASAFRRKNY